jgi:hypothetical protein
MLGTEGTLMTIQLYGFWRANAAFRVRVALAPKNLAFDEIDIYIDILSGRQFDPAYAEASAEHVVPTLVHDGHRIFQSLATIAPLALSLPTDLGQPVAVLGTKLAEWSGPGNIAIGPHPRWRSVRSPDLVCRDNESEALGRDTECPGRVCSAHRGLWFDYGAIGAELLAI